MNHTAILQEDKTFSFLRSATLVILSSILIGLFAKVSIPLPFTPVPLATQSGVVLILSFLLGSKRAFASVLLFLTQGAAGLPVFIKGAGIAYLFGPTGGYLVGYLAAAVLVGYLSEKKRLPLVWTMLSGTAVISLFGVSYLACLIGIKKAIVLGFLPFIIGDYILKIIAGTKILQAIRRPL